MEETFRRFGVGHLLILVAIPILAALSVRVTRWKPQWKGAVRKTLAWFLLAVELGFVVLLVLHGDFTIEYGLPLQLSDATVLLMAFAALRLNRFAFDVAWYWALTAMPLTLLTPDVVNPFPDPYTILFFIGHSVVIILSLYLVGSGTIRPRPGSAWRSFLVLNAFAAFVMAFNVAFDTNYMFLMERPGQPSPLDWFGPWPVYILTADVLALFLFMLLYLPWRLPEARQTA